MSNLNTHGVRDYDTAQAFLGAKSQRRLCFATTLTQVAAGGQLAVEVRHHDSAIVRYFADGRIEIRNAGWLSSTTTDRLRRMTPTTVRVSRARGGHVDSPEYVGPQPTHTFERVI